jgi:hypothetical protein
MFQDDGSRQARFAPYSPNSGTCEMEMEKNIKI